MKHTFLLAVTYVFFSSPSAKAEVNSLDFLIKLGDKVSSYEPLEIDYPWNIKEMSVRTTNDAQRLFDESCVADYIFNGEDFADTIGDFLEYFVAPDPYLGIPKDFILDGDDLKEIYLHSYFVGYGENWQYCSITDSYYGYTINEYMTNGDVFGSLYTGQPD